MFSSIKKLFYEYRPQKSSTINNDIIKFVILAVPRTGSNYLCGMLNTHPEILCHHEVFNPEDIFYALDYRNGRIKGNIDERNKYPKLFLNNLLELNFGHNAVGFKFMTGQNARALNLIRGDMNIKKIILKRKNKIKTYVSLLIAEKTRSYSSVIKDDNPAAKHKTKLRPILISNY